jgi:hypothetical protein
MKSKNTVKHLIITLVLVLAAISNVFAQDLKMTMNFAIEDSVKKCKVLVATKDSVAKNVEVKLYVKRLYSLLPIGKAANTDETGTATFDFPTDLPSDKNGKLIVVAKIEDPATEVSSTINWGIPRAELLPLERCLAASRGKAPYYLMIVSNLIIMGIWGTLFYVVWEIYRKRMPDSKHKKTIIHN